MARRTGATGLRYDDTGNSLEQLSDVAAAALFDRDPAEDNRRRGVASRPNDDGVESGRSKMQRDVDDCGATVGSDRSGVARRIRDGANAKRDISRLEPSEGV
jgi:hypothetical protein